jgi:hypothetical protein
MAQTIWERKEVDPPLRDRKKNTEKDRSETTDLQRRVLQRKIPVRSQQQDKEAEKSHAESLSEGGSSGYLAARMRVFPG